MPNARGALTAVFIDDILYAIGGEGESGVVGINEAYNSKTNNWISKSPMPTPRHHVASAVVDGNVYVIGGRVQGVSPITNVNVNEMYNPKEDKWIKFESMPSKRSGISAASINNAIYAEVKILLKHITIMKNIMLKIINGNLKSHYLLLVMDCQQYLLMIKYM